jgi:hypothetical protein
VEFGYQAATAPVDVSGAGIYTYSKLDTSGDVYYDTITHNLGNSYPVVELVRSSNNEHIMPVLVRSLNPNEVRVWVDDNVSSRIVVLG